MRICKDCRTDERGGPLQWVAKRGGSEMGGVRTERRVRTGVWGREREVWCLQVVCCGEQAGWEVAEVEMEVRLGWVMLCVY